MSSQIVLRYSHKITAFEIFFIKYIIIIFNKWIIHRVVGGILDFYGEGGKHCII
jgi:hypothetical protein